ncbi:MAG: class I SAM-dependent methyltransferase [Azoarcus sp.]|nr:class I SAM-dependent methyltransferase [Azoarcus sp.]
MTGATVERKPHASRNLASRKAKGLKIERLLGLADRAGPVRMLDIGTGSGGVAHYFAAHPTLDFEVTSIDVVDQRQISDGYRFLQVESVALPFPDKCFDVVITNHVIEHVGPARDQLEHLKEVRRVMHPEGVGYLAVPNRWMLVEPHYRLAFLSWLPRPLRTPYLRFRGVGEFYDCEPLTVPQLERLLSEAGFAFHHLHLESVRQTLLIEGAVGLRRCVTWFPDWLLMMLRRASPTLIYTIQHSRY